VPTDRRAFLSAVAALTATALASCWPSEPAPASTSAGATNTPAPSGSAPRSSGSPLPPDWSALAHALSGTLVRPADPDYDRVRVLYNTRFDAARPQAVARCTSSADVRACVLFARRYGVPLALRSGGHSYAGYSTGSGLVIDVRPMNTVAIRANDVRVGAGAPLIDVYAELAAHGVGVAAGSCPSVGITGLTLAGGLGVLARSWGLTIDSLTEAEIVTADGAVRTCDEQRDADLFWALRGGGGGSFGVVTSLTLRTRPIARMALGFLRWDAAHARAVLTAWQDWIAAAPDELWSNVHVNASTTAEVGVHATLLGEQAKLATALDALARAVGASPTYREVGALPYLDAMLLEAGCVGRTVEQCHLKGDTAQGALDRETYAATSVIAARALSDASLDALTAVLKPSDPGSEGSRAVIIDALGGAVAKVAPDATAFPHRRAFASIQVLTSWDGAAPSAVADASRLWLRSYTDALRSTVGGAAYVGYIDPGLADWQAAYWGANYARLQQVKAAYDPDNAFTFAQAIPLP
jgi:FAD/FMN-containing dehydrogenase